MYAALPPSPPPQIPSASYIFHTLLRFLLHILHKKKLKKKKMPETRVSFVENYTVHWYSQRSSPWLCRVPKKNTQSPEKNAKPTTIARKKQGQENTRRTAKI